MITPVTLPLPRTPWYRILYVQVLIAVVVGILVGHYAPGLAIKLKPLGDAFIKLIKLLIAPIIFCTVVHGVASMRDLKKLGRMGGKTLLYFEVVSTLALIIGLVVVNVLRPGDGFNVDAKTLDPKLSQAYVQGAQHATTAEFLLNIIPNTFVGAFVSGDLLPVLFVSILTAFAISALGERGVPALHVIDRVAEIFFGIMRIVVKAAPIGAFGAMSFTIGSYGLDSLKNLAALMTGFYLTAACLRRDRARRNCGVVRLFHLPIPRFHQGGITPRARHQFLGNRIAGHDSKNAPTRLRPWHRGPGHTHWLQLQPRRHQHLHGHGRRVSRPSHQHAARSATPDWLVARGHDYLKGRERGDRGWLHRPGCNARGRAGDSRRLPGTFDWHRPFHERMPRNNQPHRQRGRHRGHQPVGGRGQQRNVA